MSHIIHTGSNLDVLPTLPDNSIDAIVTDPPYELGFMGKSWDSTGIAYNVGLWRECLRVLKPGGHILAFGGSRTYHRMACAIEDAGFEVRDQIMWVYGSGFPKSHNISKALDKSEGHWRGKSGKVISVNEAMSGGNYERTPLGSPITAAAKQWEGWGTALKPAHEPICLARKPFDGTVADNVLKWGVGGLNIDGCRVANNGEQFGELPNRGGCRVFNTDGQTFQESGYDYKEGDLNAEAVAKLKSLGRFPANLIHDGHQQVLDLFPSNAGAAAPVKSGHSGESNGIYGDYAQRGDDGATFYADKGSAARFFYCPKANKTDRNEGCEALQDKEWKNDGACIPERGDRPFNPSKNNHPTVKPTELMRYLCRLITPPGGTVLDPFNGSGSTGKAAVSEGFNYVGIELDPDYVAIALARINGAITK